MPVRLGRPKARRPEPNAPPEVSEHSDASRGPNHDIPEKARRQNVLLIVRVFQKRVINCNNKDAHLECNSELFQRLLMEVLLVKEQQQLEDAPVRGSE